MYVKTGISHHKNYCDYIRVVYDNDRTFMLEGNDGELIKRQIDSILVLTTEYADMVHKCIGYKVCIRYIKNSVTYDEKEYKLNKEEVKKLVYNLIWG